MENNESMNQTGVDPSSIQPANIMVAGITGTGKSTLINAVFGFEDSKGAKTGTGKPITDHIDEYRDPDTPIRIWDTVGLELDSAKTKASIDSIKQTIADKAQATNHLDVIHAIWYCINSGSSRYQEAELKFIKELYSIGVPFIIVLTQCIDDPEDIAVLEKEIKEENQKNGMGNIEIVQVLAKDYKTRLGTIEAYGLKDLVDVTLDELPEFLKNGFAAAQKVDKAQKRSRSEEIIFDMVSKAKSGFWDKVPLINYIPTNSKMIDMLGNIGKMYNLVFSEKDLDNMLKNTSIDWENAFDGLINPFGKKYSEKVTKLLEGKRKEGFDASVDFGKWDRSAQVIAFYGYTFVETLEGLWDKYTEEEIKKIDDDMVKIIKETMNEKLKKVNKKESRR
jgi:predicted GTPase